MAHKCPTITGSADDPEFRRERARLAAASTNSVDGRIRSIERRADEVTPEQRDRLVQVAAPTDDDFVAVLVRRAPRLTEETRSQLRRLLATDGSR